MWVSVPRVDTSLPAQCLRGIRDKLVQQLVVFVALGHEALFEG